MAKKRKGLFLYLTLACFLGLIAIFIADGYLGIYDTIYIIAGEREEKVEPDFWLQQDMSYSAGVNWDEKALFTYEVDNRLFSSYSTDIDVSLWHSQEKVADLLSQQLTLGAFDKEQLEWVVDTTEFEPNDIPQKQGYQYSLIIKRGEIERRIILYIGPTLPVR